MADAEEARVQTSEEDRYTLNLPVGFSSKNDATGSLGSYAGPGGLTMSLSRIDYPNLPAYWRNDKENFFRQVFDGTRRSVAGFKHRSKKAQRIDRVPVFDMHFERNGESGKEQVWMRFLFHRHFGIVATASTPLKAKRKLQKRAKAFTRSLQPFLPDKP
jgi:hypothetical protein